MPGNRPGGNDPDDVQGDDHWADYGDEQAGGPSIEKENATMNPLISVPHLLERVGDLAIPTPELIKLQHAMQIKRFGGGEGIRDEGLLASAVARGAMAAAYEDGIDAIGVACRICEGVIRNHPFVDGNKRAGFAALASVLSLNGYRLEGEADEMAASVIDLAAGRVPGSGFEDWVRGHAEIDDTYELIERRSHMESIGDAPQGGEEAPGM